MKCENKVCRQYSLLEDNNCKAYLTNEFFMCSHKVLEKEEAGTGQDNKEYCEHKGSKGWDDGTSFETQCGTKYYLTWECLFKYCPYCGKEIKL